MKIYAIGVGADALVTLDHFARGGGDLDEGTLQAIAGLTGGRYFRARDTRELEEIYAILDALEPIARDEERLRPIRELFPLPLGIALGAGGGPAAGRFRPALAAPRRRALLRGGGYGDARWMISISCGPAGSSPSPPALPSSGPTPADCASGERWREVCDAALLPHLLAHRDGAFLPLPPVLMGGGLILAVLALAGPAWHAEEQTVHRVKQARDRGARPLPVDGRARPAALQAEPGPPQDGRTLRADRGKVRPGSWCTRATRSSCRR